MATALAASLAGVLGTSAATSLALANIVVGGVVSYVSSAFARPGGSRPSPVTQTSRSNGAIGSQRILLGRVSTLGHDMFPPYCHDRYGQFGRSVNSGQYQTLGIALCDLPIVGVHSVIIQGTEFIIGTHLVDDGDPGGLTIPSGLAEEYDQYRGLLTVKIYDGTQTEADPFMRGVFQNHPTRPYTADMIYQGGAYALVTVEADSEWTDLTDIRFVCDGIRINGAFTKNPIVMAAALAEGIALPSGDVFGPQMDVDPDYLAAAIAAVVDAGFEAGLEVQIGGPDGNGVDALDAIEDLLDACLGRAWDDGGILRFTALDGGLPIVHITDQDILVSKGQTAEKSGSISDKSNSVTITHPNAEGLWALEAAPTFTDADAVARDGERLPIAVTFPAITNVDQAQTIAAMMVADAQQVRVHTFALPLSYGYLTVQDKFTWTSESNAYDAKVFRVEAISRLPGHTLVTARETDPEDFNPAAVNITPHVQNVIRAIGPGEIVPTAVYEATTIDDAAGIPFPAVNITVVEPPNVAQEVRWQYRVKGQAATVSGSFPAAEFFATAPLAALSPTVYEIRSRFVTPDRTTPWGEWFEFTSLDARISPSALSLDTLDLVGDIADALIDGAVDGVSERVDNVSTQLDGISDNLRDQFALVRAQDDTDASNLQGVIDSFLSDEGLRRSNATVIESVGADAFNGIESEAVERRVLAAELVNVGEGVADVSAQLVEEQLARVTQDSALASDISGLSAGIAGNASAIINEQQARIDQNSALASNIQSLSTTLGENTTAITETTQVVDGISAERTLLIDNNGFISGIVFRSELGDNNVVASQAAFIADQFSIVGPGDNPEAPFTVLTTPQNIDGITYEPGVYIDRVIIREGAIGRVQIANAAIGSAEIENGSIGSAEVGLIQSPNYSEDAEGTPITGARINFTNGDAKFAGPVISRNIVLNEGQFTVTDEGQFSDDPPGVGINGANVILQDGAEIKFINTGIRMSRDDAWMVTNDTIIVVASVTESSNVSSDAFDRESFFGIEATPLSGGRMRDFGTGGGQPDISYQDDPPSIVDMPGGTGTEQRLFFNIRVHTQNRVTLTNPTIAWKVFRVS